MRKKLGIEMLTCIIKSKAPGSNEFILHAPDHFDLRIQCDKRDAFLDLLKLRFAHMKPDVTLRVYALPQANLKDYHVTPNRRGGVEHYPPDEFRLGDQEIKSEMDYLRESAASMAPAKQPPKEEAKKAGAAAGMAKGTATTASSTSMMSGGSSSTSLDTEDHFDFAAPERKDTKEKRSGEQDVKSMTSE